MKAAPLNPPNLEGILRLLLSRVVDLAIPAITALGRDTRAGTRLYDRVVRLGLLIHTLLRRLPEFAAAALNAKPPRPRKDREERVDDDEQRIDRIERIIPLGKSVPAIVAQICRELALISKALGQEAREELAALATQAKAAAATWPASPPPPPSESPEPTPALPHTQHPAPFQPPPPQPPILPAQPRGSG